MQVYDLDKTQEWLNRTIQLNRTPPVRGGVRTDHRARRQTAAGVLLFVSALTLIVWITTALRTSSVQPLAAPAPAKAESVVAALPAVPAPEWIVRPQPPAFVPERQPAAPPPGLGWSGFSLRVKGASHRSDRRTVDRSSAPPGTFAAPPAPTWLDGK
jgi:hypothetical protein